ncbi:hypothetical protein [Okeania sp. SIO2B3]|uniref:hypothetical protein n=1 Tax=Okeania sp. SIO2B3 TaxID=2607784 RepID=UPI0013C234D6|nr:hypothetical protein [Okeania sp. SIO2B3]NET40645.1 hypothetical protein [Okeania sp. SIO2B3]
MSVASDEKKRANAIRPYDSKKRGRMPFAPTTRKKEGECHSPLRLEKKRANAIRPYDF